MARGEARLGREVGAAQGVAPVGRACRLPAPRAVIAPGRVRHAVRAVAARAGHESTETPDDVAYDGTVGAGARYDRSGRTRRHEAAPGRPGWSRRGSGAVWRDRY